MYIIKKEASEYIKGKYKSKFLENEVGLSTMFLNLVLNGKKGCSKKTAYAITKAINSNANISDFFNEGAE